MTEVMNLDRVIKFYKSRKSSHSSNRFDLENNIEWLSNYFLNANEECSGEALSPIHRMKICQRYQTDSGFQDGVGEELGVEQPFICSTVPHFHYSFFEPSVRKIQTTRTNSQYERQCKTTFTNRN